MRGGAIPYLAWGTLLAILGAINWIWTGDAIQVATFGFAALVTYLSGAVLWLLRRDAVRPGPPEPRSDPEAVPEGSVSGVLIGVSVACILFGLAWAKFLVDFGAGMLVLSLGRLAVELSSERETRRRAQRRGGR